ncbi:MAG TPA: hypothetical protein QGG59_05230 [Planctomycetota bacterium]|jgi:hypothetical protein|nr:hypothetical protein [Planctomycetota bacterium]MDP7245445.1 hypothetical protein [Planctomycetota bacterium]MDP7560106.1 hypothetical protein [Planctomycetota bacterium]HJM39499.1 hypothetical protein [Planctomycetota bacterium]|tara:strand:- start:4360 stop:4902 length:543 start_codon:yes stop_codon:yes gene_type:complete
MRFLGNLFFLCLLTFSCQSSQGKNFESGMVRTALAASWSSSKTETAGVSTESRDRALLASSGAFLTPTMEAGLEFSYDQEDGEATKTTGRGASLYGRFWQSPSGPNRTWAQAGLGWSDREIGSDLDGGLWWNASIGVTQFMTKNGALETSIRWNDQSFSSAGFDDSQTRTSLLLSYAIFY